MTNYVHICINILPQVFQDLFFCLLNQGCGGSPTSPPDNMTPSMLRRQLKNLVQNYSEAEVKVRILPGAVEKNASLFLSLALFFLLLHNTHELCKDKDKQKKTKPFPSFYSYIFCCTL